MRGFRRGRGNRFRRGGGGGGRVRSEREERGDRGGGRGGCDEREGAPEEGALLYEDEYVRIGLLGQSAEYSKYSSQTQFQWELSFVNKKDMDLEIRFSDFYIDGVKEDTSLLYAYVMEAVVGAGARTNHRMLHFVDGDQPLPEVSFRVRVQAAGSGALYNYSEKRVTIKPQ